MVLGLFAPSDERGHRITQEKISVHGLLLRLGQRPIMWPRRRIFGGDEYLRHCRVRRDGHEAASSPVVTEAASSMHASQVTMPSIAAEFLSPQFHIDEPP